MIPNFLKCSAVACAIVTVFVVNNVAVAEVTVTLSEQRELSIVGDDQQNGVAIYVGDPADKFTVFTDVDIHTYDVLDINSVTIRMGRDVDSVLIELLQPLLADITIDTGHARDRVTLRDQEAGGGEFSNLIAGDVSINTGHGNDHVAISSVAIGGNLDISTGNGRDEVEFNTSIDTTAMAGSIDVLGSLALNTGVDNDSVSFYRFGTNVAQHFLLELGQGDDTIYAGYQYGEQSNVGGVACLSGGQGYDTLPLSGAVVTAPEIIEIGFEN